MLFMAFQGNVLHHHGGVDLGRDHRADALLGLVAFITIWAIAIYAPIAHWVWGGGWLAQLGAFDFAGGTVVHVNAAAAAFVAAMVIGKRTDYGSSSILPHNVPFVLLGAGMLWFGWFGFNAGSALAASPQAGLAFVTTMLAPAATLVWTLLDAMRTGKPTSVGCATACRRPRRRDACRRLHQSAERPALGDRGCPQLLPGILVRSKTSLDDSLDVVAAHGLGGTLAPCSPACSRKKALNGAF